MTSTPPEPDSRPGAQAEPAGAVGVADPETVPVRVVTTTVDTPERGSLSIDDVVVEKVAIAAAMEIEHVGGAARRLLGVPTGRDDGGTRPQVSARVTGQVATLDLRLSVSYPASVRATTEAVRDHVRDRVAALTELRVSRVDITVAALATTTTSAKRVVA